VWTDGCASPRPEMWAGRPRLVLASSSPRRRSLLEHVGAVSEVRTPGTAELVDGTRNPEVLACDLALGKARSVARTLGTGIVLGADTLVVLDGEFLGKPASAAEAQSMLSRLSGRTHRVVTGIALVDAESSRSARAHATTAVTFRPLSDAEIDAYVATGEPFDKAGAYGAQGYAGLFVRSIRGCFYNVVGLPLALLVTTLDDFLAKE
jgi:septum formation protein